VHEQLAAHPVLNRPDPAGLQTDFADWVSLHLAAMANLAARLVGSADRDDMVQESLARAWKRRHTYDQARGTAKTWLLAIVADRCRRHHRRWMASAFDATPEAVVGYEPDVDLARAILRLPHRQRLAVELHYYVGLSVIETAQVMGCSEGTVKSTLSDARHSLRRQLEER
jgi:RNA polymerase sigma-70 factor (ECF subfamily)